MSDDLKVVVIPKEFYYHEKEYVQRLENIAHAFLLFHKGGPWLQEDTDKWKKLVGSIDITTKELCNFVRRVLGEEK
jgi:hypothetical protein